MRNYTAPQVAILSDKVVRHTLLVEITLPLSTLRYCDAAVDVQALGETWFGSGDLLSIQFAAEDQSMAANTSTVSLSGVTAAAASLALRTPMAGAPIRILHALYDDNWTLVGTPQVEFRGRISHMALVNEGSTSNGR